MPKAPIVVFDWEAPEFRHYPKKPAWFITMFVIVGLLIAYQIIIQDWFGAASLAILAILIFYFAKQTPQSASIQITDRGIHINNDLISYDRIKHFWVIDTHEHKVLNLETTAYLNHLLAIELEDQDADEIREFLIDILPEHSEIELTPAQKIAHHFRF